MVRSTFRTLVALGVTALCLVLTATPVAAGTAVVVSKASTNAKVVALTFDDGWSPNRTRQLVDILDARGVPATFFPSSDAVALDPALWRSIAQRHPIANHTRTHPRLTRMTATQVYGEIVGARRDIEAATGRRMVRILRPPYGAYNRTVLEQSFAAGFKVIALWSVDSNDWRRGITADQVVANSITARPGGIVLLHAGPSVTVQALPRIIRHYRARGYRFVTLPELLNVRWNGPAIAASQFPPPPEIAALPTRRAVELSPARPPYFHRARPI